MVIKRTIEEKENLSEEDIRAKLKTLSPILRQEYLENLLSRLNLDPSIKLLASRELVELYVRRGLYYNAAKIMESAAISFPSLSVKKDIYKQAGILHLKAGNFLNAEDCFKKSLENALEKERPFLRKEFENIFVAEAEFLESKGRKQKACEMYEKILRSDIDEYLKKKISERLLSLYEKLGKLREYFDLRESLKRS